MIRTFMAAKPGRSWEELPDKVAMQLNDTHPSIGVAELMRLLMDEYHLGWTLAWNIVCKVFAYTNHTVLPEALEKWPVSLMKNLLPRISGSAPSCPTLCLIGLCAVERAGWDTLFSAGHCVILISIVALLQRSSSRSIAAGSTRSSRCDATHPPCLRPIHHSGPPFTVKLKPLSRWNIRHTYARHNAWN